MPDHRRYSSIALAALLLAATACLPARAGNIQDPNLVQYAGSGNLEQVNASLQAGADVNYRRGDTGRTALQAAASGGHADVVRALLAAGAKVNARSNGGYTALLEAVLGSHVEVVKILLAARADPDLCASSYAQCRGPLMVALAGGNREMVRVLLEGGANVNATTSYGATPLRFAIWGGGPESVAMVKDLLARGALVDAGQAPRYEIRPERSAIHSNGEVTISGVRERSAEGTLLGEVAAIGNAEVVKMLLGAGAKVDARQPGWRTPLMLAAISGHTSIVQLLLDAGADVNTRDSSNRTALDLAVANNRQEVAQMLRNAAAAPAPR